MVVAEGRWHEEKILFPSSNDFFKERKRCGQTLFGDFIGFEQGSNAALKKIALVQEFLSNEDPLMGYVMDGYTTHFEFAEVLRKATNQRAKKIVFHYSTSEEQRLFMSNAVSLAARHMPNVHYLETRSEHSPKTLAALGGTSAIIVGSAATALWGLLPGLFLGTLATAPFAMAHFTKFNREIGNISPWDAGIYLHANCTAIRKDDRKTLDTLRFENYQSRTLKPPAIYYRLNEHIKNHSTWVGFEAPSFLSYAFKSNPILNTDLGMYLS